MDLRGHNSIHTKASWTTRKRNPLRLVQMFNIGSTPYMCQMKTDKDFPWDPRAGGYSWASARIRARDWEPSGIRAATLALTLPPLCSSLHFFLFFILSLSLYRWVFPAFLHTVKNENTYDHTCPLRSHAIKLGQSTVARGRVLSPDASHNPRSRPPAPRLPSTVCALEQTGSNLRVRQEEKDPWVQ